MTAKPEYLDDPKAEKAFFQGIAWFCGITEEKAREIYTNAVAEDEPKKGKDA